ncbi:MAG: aspartyl-phosphate phosphatase Spo0E family protein [Clostridia bacterium]|nr:aspartyl-phosphate phosphatase Spo0E family protein [Clostridia bacterium]
MRLHAEMADSGTPADRRRKVRKPTMDEAIEERLDLLRQDIEALRAELHDIVIKEGTACASGRAYAVSGQLDKLIVQFLRVKERIPTRE